MDVCAIIMNTGQYRISHQVCVFLLPDTVSNYIKDIKENWSMISLNMKSLFLDSRTHSKPATHALTPKKIQKS